MKIVCLGKNYRAHAQEMQELLGDVTKPLVFLKPPTALLYQPGPIRLPDYSTNVHHEIELVVEIGVRCKAVAAAHAWEVIAGYRVGLDLTARDLQQEAKRHGWPWTLAKGFDTSAPISRLYRPDEVDGEITATRLRLWVNGDLRQEGTTAQMELAVPQVVAYLSGYMTLEEGDLLFTGTPAGVGPIRPGDELIAAIDALGEMRFTVATG